MKLFALPKCGVFLDVVDYYRPQLHVVADMTSTTRPGAGSDRDAFNQVSGPTPASYAYEKSRRGSGARWNPKGWSRRSKVVAVIGVVVILFIIIVVPVAVVESRDNRYPDYSKLNYQLTDTCRLFHREDLLLDSV